MKIPTTTTKDVDNKKATTTKRRFFLGGGERRERRKWLLKGLSFKEKKTLRLGIDFDIRLLVVSNVDTKNVAIIKFYIKCLQFFLKKNNILNLQGKKIQIFQLSLVISVANIFFLWKRSFLRTLFSLSHTHKMEKRFPSSSILLTLQKLFLFPLP